MRGLGSLVALPPVGAMAPARAVGAGRPAATASGSPLRMVFLGFPNGVNLEHWRSEGSGRTYKAGRTLAPLARHRSQIQVFSGFAQRNADAKGDGPGDHARANAAFLTGLPSAQDRRQQHPGGVSVDQVAADQLRGPDPTAVAGDHLA